MCLQDSLFVQELSDKIDEKSPEPRSKEDSVATSSHL